MDNNLHNSNIENENTVENIGGEAVEHSDKIETKGLKLKKSTKDKLNNLQSQFEDAETMVVSLLQLYNANQIESSDKYLDRKAEIQRFNFLLDSLKGSYINSLEMATYAEEKSLEKFKKELQKRNITIENLQNDNNSYKEDIQLLSKEKQGLEDELVSVKESFSRVNLALSTVERELKEKSDIIQNTQKHIDSLNLLIVKEQETKKIVEDLKNKLHTLEDINTKHEILEQLYNNSKEECSKLYKDVDTLKIDNEKQREYSNSLNEKLHSLLTTHSLELLKVNEENRKNIDNIQKDSDITLRKANVEINELKDIIYSLKLENEKLKFEIVNREE